VSSHPSRITAPLPQPGQRTPSGQRGWRTSAKHLASSSSPERLTNSDAGMIAQAPCVQQPINGPLTHHSRSPVQRLPAPLPLNTPKPEKSQIRLDHTRLVPGIELPREGRSKGATGVSGLAVAHDMRADREALIPADVAPENIELVVQRVEVANICGLE